MRAAAFSAYGPPDVIELVELPMPSPGKGEVRIKVKAAALQPFDTYVRAGRMPPNGVEVSFPIITANEFSGVIDALGEGVADFAIGDAVLGRRTFGCAAEYLVVPTIDIARKPANVTWGEAAAIGGTGQTADVAIEFLGITARDTLLISGGAGGVGTIAVQLANNIGARVVATGSAANQDYLRALGAVAVIYGEGLLDRLKLAAPQGYTAALDCAGGDALDASIALVADKSRIATISDYRRQKALGVAWPNGPRGGARLQKLVDQLASGRLKATVRATYPLDRVADAHRDVESGHGQGKVIIAVADDWGG